MNKRIVKSGILISAGTLFSRILGLFREIVTAKYFGAGSSFDSFVVAFTIPNLFRRVLGEDMYERAFMPKFKRLKEEGEVRQAKTYFAKTLLVALIASILACIAVYFFIPQLAKIIGPGLKGEEFKLAVNYGYKLVPFIFLISLSTLCGAFLLFNGKSLIYSTAPAFMNLGIIIFLILFYKDLGNNSLAYAYITGGVLFLVFQLPFVIKEYLNLKPDGSRKTENQPEHLKSAFKEGGKILSLSVINKSVEITDRLVASLVGTGAISSLWYSFRIIHLPFAFFSLAVSRALAPEFSALKGKRDYSSFGTLLENGFTINLAVLLPITAFLLIFPSETITIFYKRGNFGDSALLLTSKALFYYSLALIPMGATAILGRAYSSLENNSIPLAASIGGALTNIILDFALYKTPLKQGGIALATAIALYVQTAILSAFLFKYKIAFSIKRLIKNSSYLSLTLIPYFSLLFVLKYYLRGFEGKFYYLVFIGGNALLVALYGYGALWIIKKRLKI